MSLGFGEEGGEFGAPDQFGAQFRYPSVHSGWPADLDMEEGLVEGNLNGLALGSDTAASASGIHGYPVDNLARQAERQILLPAPPRDATGNLDGGDNETDTRRSRRRHSRQGSESKSPILACHFLKSDPVKFSECRSFVLRRIKDVKQHINRKHKLPEFYCDRCFRPFESREDKTGHVRENPPCEVRKAPPFEGVTEQQREQFRLHHSRGKSVKEQWYDMWDVIFPGQRRPASIYLDNGREARVRMLRNLWGKRRDEIVEDALRPLNTRVNETMDKEVFNRVMDTFLRHVETESIDVDITESDITLVEKSAPSLETPQEHQDLLKGKHQIDDEPDPDPYGDQIFDVGPFGSPFPWPDGLGVEDPALTPQASQQSVLPEFAFEMKQGGSDFMTPNHSESQCQSKDGLY